jgi:hypothetical protein
MGKTFISANLLLRQSFELARKVWDDGYRPNYIIGLWRGGTPPGIAIHELLEFYYTKYGLSTPIYHTAIKTQSYSKIMDDEGVEANGVDIKGVGHIIEVINSEDKLLLVDDVWERGTTVVEVINLIKKMARKNCPEIRVATVYFKPGKNLFPGKKPDYYHTIDENWLVFPHEVCGLTQGDIESKAPWLPGLLEG